MSDNQDAVTPEGPAESEEVAEVRDAWMGLIRLLAKEVVLRLERDETTPGGDMKPTIPSPTAPRTRPKSRRSGRSRDQGMG